MQPEQCMGQLNGSPSVEPQPHVVQPNTVQSQATPHLIMAGPWHAVQHLLNSKGGQTAILVRWSADPLPSGLSKC